ncbi:FAD binding domain-containing protein [Sulfurimonas sp. HSL-3221]|uniref:FAD binding domain-containing protein n=1 Tax=Thiomicrolovo sulfuroxydans TaxID=2894755 RepID=UPI001E39F909|nr:FAD binding domain-containing protein [Sulfurimonas sp. HSL-3221]UFS62297.1 FAD binding domain-containing protein [Sulfurimonas sp. HSL-3221]
MNYLRATNLGEATALLARYPEALLLCGSTDAALQLRHAAATATLIDIHALEELKGVSVEDGHMRIGALVTLNELLRSDVVRASLPLLAACAETFGSHQIRNLATVGGNIANASPAADLTAALVALEATVTLASQEGERSVPLEAFYCGYKCTKLDHELITAVTVPLQTGEWYYRKAGMRERLNIAKVSIALTQGHGGFRISGASLGPNPVRFRTLEALLDGGVYDDAAIKEALESDTDPSGGHRSTKAYRLRVAFNMIKEALSQPEER